MTGLRASTPTAASTSEEREFVAELIVAQDEPVLEIGTGLCACMAQALARRGFRVFTVDRDRAAALEANQVLAAAGLRGRTRVVVADASNLPFRRGSVRTAVAYSALHHATDLEGAVRGIASVLNERGRLIVSDWDEGANGVLDRLLQALEAWFEEVTVVPRGIRRVYVCEEPHRRSCDRVLHLGETESESIGHGKLRRQARRAMGAGSRSARTVHAP
ncbi:MAG: class I SAM-dependent methyltransferase [Gemmatimonadota bacterium]|nr:MAG: class I SAM-dependent methyltransferase [Gemmatimonadota bacterium]